MDPKELIEVPKTDVATLTGALKDVLVHCVLPASSCRGQAYDGAANMSGHLREVATCIKIKGTSSTSCPLPCSLLELMSTGFCSHLYTCKRYIGAGNGGSKANPVFTKAFQPL